MANQAEGFTPVRNSLLEALMRSHLSGGALSVVLAVLRHTEGYEAEDGRGRRQAHQLSLGYLAQATSRDRSKIGRIVNDLIRRRILLVVREGTYRTPRTLSINRVSPEWETVPQTATVPREGDSGVPLEGYRSVPLEGYQIKKDLKKGKKGVLSLEHRKTAEALYDLYAVKVRAGARADAIRNISKLLTAGISPDELRASINAYAGNGMQEEVKFRIQANNFFGTAERWKEYRQPGGAVEAVPGPSLTQKLLSGAISEEEKRGILQGTP